MARYDFASQRLYVDEALAAGACLTLKDQAAHYLLHVLRMEAGARLLVFNGKEGEWTAELFFPSRKQPQLRVLDLVRPQIKAGRLRYAFAPIKAARLDYMVQKAVEMGVSTLAPVITQYTQMRGLKTEKMNANCIEAAEQCGILNLPILEQECSFSSFLADLPTDARLIFCDEAAELEDSITKLGEFLSPPHREQGQEVTVLIGPEGGFSEGERALLLQKPNVLRLSLGSRILRADTAAVAALALVQAFLEKPQ